MGRIELKVELSSKIYYSVNFGAVALLKPSPLTLELGDGTILGANPVLKDAGQRSSAGRSVCRGEEQGAGRRL